MARLDEIAEGIVTVLAFSATPEPLNVDLRGEGVAETTFFVRAVIDSCERRAVPIAQVHVCSELGADLLKQYGGDIGGYEGVKILSSPELHSQIQFFRFPLSA